MVRRETRSPETRIEVHQWIPLPGAAKQKTCATDRSAARSRNSTASEPGSAAYTVDRAQRMVSVRFGKNLRVQDIANYADSLRSNLLFDPSFSELVDLSKVESLDLGPDQALQLADEIDPFLPTARRAFVVGSSASAYAARMHMLLRAETQNIRIFQSIDEAKQWLQADVGQ